MRRGPASGGAHGVCSSASRDRALNVGVQASVCDWNSLCLSFQQLQMLGYDISWAAFNIIEVMSASKFTFKVR